MRSGNERWTLVSVIWLALHGCALVGYDALPRDAFVPNSDQIGETDGGVADGEAPTMKSTDPGAAGADADLEAGSIDECARALVEAPGNCGDGYDNDCDGDVDDADADCHWWNTSYRYRHKLSLDNDDPGNEALADFPLLVTLFAQNFPTADMAAGAADLRFVDADDQTPLPFEVELFDAGATSQIWVRVPMIDADSTTDHIYIYYGNESASAIPADTNTWDESYQAVFHMHGNADDSSASGYDGTVMGPVTTTGFIGNAYDFAGGTAHIGLGINRPWLRNVGAWTLEAWVRATSIDASSQPANGNWVVSMSVGTSSASINSRATIGLQNTEELGLLTRAADRDPRDSLRTTDGPIALDQWHHVVASVDYPNGMMRLYVDGSLANSGVATFSTNGTSDTDSRSASIGAEDDGSGEFFLGQIDEVRISTTRRSDWWIKAQHKSMTNAMIDYGPQESWP